MMNIIIENAMIVFLAVEYGNGIIKAISISKIIKIMVIRKNCKENGINFWLNISIPHSIGEGFSVSFSLFILIIILIINIIEIIIKVILIYIIKIF